MAAQDVTISNAAGGTSIVVTTFTRSGDSKSPMRVSARVKVVANASAAAINCPAGTAILIEHISPSKTGGLAAEVPVATAESLPMGVFPGSM